MNTNREWVFRQIISRGTMLLVGIGLLGATLKCSTIVRSTIDQSALPLLVCIFLAIAGALAVLAAVTPTWLLERIVRPPQATLFDRAEERQSNLLCRVLWWFR